jgi:3-hydroxybutyrate dehydrogenase
MAAGKPEHPVAIVTGGAGAIGSAIARRLTADGARCVIADVNVEAAERVAAEIPGAVAMRVDLMDSADCRRLVAATVDRFGRVDILVNNAGIQHIAPVHEFPDDRWNAIIQVTLTAAFLLTKAALPSMYASGWGRIVNMGSIFALVAAPNKSAYAAAKHGLVGFTQAVALEAGPFGVTANTVCPSFARTPLVMRQVQDLARTEGIAEAEVEERVMLGMTALKRFVDPEEVAALVGFLCSEAGGAMTGTALPIDAGWTAR